MARGRGQSRAAAKTKAPHLMADLPRPPRACLARGAYLPAGSSRRQRNPDPGSTDARSPRRRRAQTASDVAAQAQAMAVGDGPRTCIRGGLMALPIRSTTSKSYVKSRQSESNKRSQISVTFFGEATGTGQSNCRGSGRGLNGGDGAWLGAGSAAIDSIRAGRALDTGAGGRSGPARA